MSILDPMSTPQAEEAIQRLMKDNGGCRTTARLNLESMLLITKDQLTKLIARKAWADPRRYDAAVEALKLKA